MKSPQLPKSWKNSVSLLREFIDVFALSYNDVPGIDRDFAEHKIPLYPDIRLVKQKLHRMKSEWALKIKEMVQKQLDVGFIKVV